VSIIEPSAGKQLTIVVNRDGADVTVRVTPVKNVKYADETGTTTKVAGFLGIGAVEQRKYESTRRRSAASGRPSSRTSRATPPVRWASWASAASPATTRAATC
jgi:hypothetical protein